MPLCSDAHGIREPGSRGSQHYVAIYSGHRHLSLACTLLPGHDLWKPGMPQNVLEAWSRWQWAQRSTAAACNGRLCMEERRQGSLQETGGEAYLQGASEE